MSKSALEMAPEALRQFAEAMGMSAEAMEEFVGNVDRAAQKLTESPREELRYRLNAQLLGEDPGKPVNWRGL